MQWFMEFVQHTPLWVYALLVFLVARGLAARKPRSVTLGKLAVIPALFTVWGFAELIRLFGTAPAAMTIWLAAILLGTAIGVAMVRRRTIGVEPVSGELQMPPDYTLLPLIIVTFAVKYAIGATAAIAPAKFDEPLFYVIGIVAYGIFAGIFAGKFLIYFQRYQAARSATPSV